MGFLIQFSVALKELINKLCEFVIVYFEFFNYILG